MKKQWKPIDDLSNQDENQYCIVYLSNDSPFCSVNSDCSMTNQSSQRNGILLLEGWVYPVQNWSFDRKGVGMKDQVIICLEMQVLKILGKGRSNKVTEMTLNVDILIVLLGFVFSMWSCHICMHSVIYHLCSEWMPI